MTAPGLEFWYHMFGINMGTLEVDVLQGGVLTNIVTISGDQGNNWLRQTADLTSFSGIIQLVFRGIRGADFESDIAIDDLSFFEISSLDVAMVDVTSPVDGCLSANETISVDIANAGIDTVDFSMDTTVVGVDITGASTQSFSTTLSSGLLLPGDTLSVDVTTMGDFSTTGTYTLSAHVTTNGDGTANNDSATVDVNALPVISGPFVEDFETFTPGVPGTLMNGWTNATGDDEDWFVTQGSTPSPFTGPSEDHTLGTSAGIFLFTEASDPVPTGSQFDLLSPCIDLNGFTNPGLSFWYHMHGPDMGTLEVFVLADTGETLITTIAGEQQINMTDPWLEEVVNLGAFSGLIQLRFRGTRGAGFTSDISIDDIGMFEIPPVELELLAITSPSRPECLDSTVTVSVEVINNGADTLDFGADTAHFTIDITGANPQTLTVMVDTGSVAPGATAELELTSSAIFGVGGDNMLTVYVDSLPGDVDNSNDTVSSMYTALPVIDTYPYIETFASGPSGWGAFGSSSSWEFGTPNGAIIQGAASDTNAWVTSLTGEYNNLESSAVYSPCFDMTNAPAGVAVALKIWYEIETGWDGVVLQSSTDDGATWQNVGDFEDDFNWFNDSTLEGLPGGQNIGWTGEGSDGSGGYVQTSHPLDTSLIGKPNVRFRVAFGADQFETREGIAFDDFAIGVAPVVDLGADSVIICTGDVLDAGNPGATHVWSTGDSTQTLSIMNTTGSDITDSTISVVVTDSLGLSGGDMIVADILTTPGPGVSSVMIADNLCSDDSTGAISIDVTGTGPFTFMWSNGDTTEDLTGLPNGNYVGVITDSNGCMFESPALAVGSPDPITAAVDTIIPAGCPDDSTGAISISVSGGVGGFTFMWSNGDTTEDISGVPGGSYTGMITDTNMCVVEATLTVPNTDTLPNPSIGQDPRGSIIIFSSNAPGAGSYSWDFGDGGTDSTENPVYQYNANGTYPVTLTVTNTCGSTTVTDSVVMSQVSIEDDLLSNNISVYPNPNQGQFDIRFDKLTLEDVAISVSSVEGKQVYNEQLGYISGSVTHGVNLPASLAKGMYILQITTREGRLHKRLRIE